MPKWYMTLLLEPTNKTGPPPNKPYQSPPPLRERKGGKRAEPELHLEERGALGVLGNACQDRAHTPPTFELRGRQAGRPAPEPRGADTSLLPDIPLDSEPVLADEGANLLHKGCHNPDGIHC